MAENLKAKLGADIGDFEQGFAKAQKVVNDFSKEMKSKMDDVSKSLLSAGKGVSVLSGALAGAITGIVAMTKATGQFADDLGSIAVALDTTTDKLQEYRHIAQQVGTDIETFEKATQMLNMRLKGLDEGSAIVGDRLKQLGIATHTAGGEMRSLGDISDELIIRLSQIENVSERNVLATELFGRQWVNVASFLDAGADGIERLRQEAHELGIVVGEDALNSAMNFHLAMEKLGSQFKSMKDNLAGQLAPVLSDTFIPIIQDTIVPLVQKFADWIGRVAERFNGLSDTTKKIVIAVGGFVVALGPALLAIAGVVKVIGIMGGALTALTSPITLVVGAIAGAVYLIIKHWDKIKDYFTNGAGAKFLDAFMTQFRIVFGAITNVVESFVGFVEGAFDVLKGLFSGDINQALDGLHKMFDNTFQAIWGVVKSTLAGMANLLGEFFNWIGAKKWGTGLQEWAEKTAPKVDALDKTVDKITGTFSKNEKEVKKATETSEGYASAITGVTTAVGGLIPQMEARISKLKEEQLLLADPTMVRALSDQIALLEGRLAVMKMTTEEFNKYKRESLEPLKIEGISVESDILGGLQGTLDDYDNTMRDAFNKMQSRQEQLADLGSQFADTLRNTIANSFEHLTDIIAGAGDLDTGKIVSSLLMPLADMAISAGMVILTTGKALESLKLAFADLFGVGPAASVALGAGLIAVGVMAKAGLKSIASGGGGGAKSSYKVAQATTATPTGDFRQAYFDGEVEFKIGQDALVGVLKSANTKYNRL